MSTLFITFTLLLLVMTTMSVGLFFGKKPITGSCGGLKAIDEIGDCEICRGNINECPKSDA